MSILWLLISAAFAIINWVALEKQWRWVVYTAKPGTIVALFLWLYTTVGLQDSLALFALGLVFSSVGDVLLMLPNGPFIGGLVAFLLAQISYIFGFNHTAPPLSLFGLVLAIVVGLIGRRIYTRLALALDQKGQSRMRLPVLVYAVAISLMLLSAFLTILKPEWELIPALLASLGALSFFISDTLLAWDRFVTPLSHRGLKVNLTYQLGQITLIAGVILNYKGSF